MADTPVPIGPGVTKNDSITTTGNVWSASKTNSAIAGGGGGNVVGPGSSVAHNLTSFADTTGLLLEDSGKAPPGGAIVGTTDTQTLTNKSIATSQLTGALPAANFPAMTGDVTSSAGSLATAIGSGKVTNAMLAGSIALPKLLSQPPLYLYYNIGTSSLTWTAMPAAETILNTSTNAAIKRANITNYSTARIIAKISTLAASGKIIARYNTANSVSGTVAGNWVNDLGVSEISIPVTAVGMIVSSPVAIAAGALGDFNFALVGSGGDGATTSPVFGYLVIEFT